MELPESVYQEAMANAESGKPVGININNLKVAGISLPYILKYHNEITEEAARRQRVSPPISVYEIIAAIQKEYPHFSVNHPRLNDIVIQFAEEHFAAWRTNYQAQLVTAI